MRYIFPAPKYPMKRIDFDPDGERNPQNRGKSPYVRISWDEALDIVAGEIKRVKDTYGGSAISGMTYKMHIRGPNNNWLLEKINLRAAPWVIGALPQTPRFTALRPNG